MRKKILKIIFDLLLVILLIISIYSCYKYSALEVDKNKVNKKIKNNISFLENNNNKKTLDYYRDFYNNQDIIGSLKIDGTSINTLLVKGNDNEYYLNHSLKKEYDEIGSIYIDYRTDLNSKQINIYGHNSNVYNVIFKELEKYLDKEYYSNHKYIEIWDGDATKKYEIFSIQIVTSQYEHIDVYPTDWDKHIKILSNSIYETNSSVDIGDDILIIQTCYYNPKDSLLLINAKKI